MATPMEASIVRLSFLNAGTAPTQGTPALLFAAGWLAVCALCALVYWALVLLIFRRRRKHQPANRGVLFVALLLVAFAGSNLAVADTFAVHQPLFFLPVSGFFLLFFYLFSDGRYAPTWTRWLVLLYGVSQIGPLFPQTPKQSDPQVTQFLAHIPGWIVTLGLDASAVLGDMLLVTVIVLGVVPQVYFRYRHLCETGTFPPIQRRIWGVLGATLGAASFLVLVISALLTPSSLQAPSPAFLCARTAFYILVTTVPVAMSFMLLRGQIYDRDTLVNRLLIYGTLTICLILVYIAATGLRFFIPGILTLPLLLVFVAIVAPIMVALFPPLHAQIQDRVNRRFFRRTYDAARILAAYHTTLREETHLDQLSVHLVAAIQKSMHSNFVTLWLCTPATRIAPFSAAALSRLMDADIGAGRTRPPERPSEIRLRQQAATATPQTLTSMLAIAPDDPARAVLLRSSAALELARLPEASPTVVALRGDGTQVVLPLLWQGELVGVLALGPRPGAQRYTLDDRELLTALADDVTPTLHLAHVTHEQNVELRQRERVEQELQMARRIQEALLPKTVPALTGWQLATCYQPAREVGGDFYDFLTLADGRLGLVLGDVTDKGIPAALVMATTRSMLRAVAAQPSISPGQVLAQVNELLCPDLPATMFVTCFYAILDPASGHLQYANAGQDLPYLRHVSGEVGELHATGMPLGLLPGSRYEEGETTLAPGDDLLFFSDGLVEAHNSQREMFGLPRLAALLREHADGSPPIVFLLHELAEFTGTGWEQEDDITLVVLQRLEGECQESEGSAPTEADEVEPAVSPWRTLDAWTQPSVPGTERTAIARVVTAVRPLGLAPTRLERLKTAVGEATMNAMEHGNGYQPDRPVALEVRASPSAVAVRITDQGSHVSLPPSLPPSLPAPLPTSLPTPEIPDLGAKLAGLQSPRGWGLFLINELVDAVHVTGDASHHTVELILALDDTQAATDSSARQQNG